MDTEGGTLWDQKVAESTIRVLVEDAKVTFLRDCPVRTQLEVARRATSDQGLAKLFQIIVKIGKWPIFGYIGTDCCEYYHR